MDLSMQVSRTEIGRAQSYLLNNGIPRRSSSMHELIASKLREFRSKAQKCQLGTTVLTKRNARDDKIRNETA
ncbi:hypothetical protein BDN72DRAFT_844673 [Pluteus cervinus]|uniref:Uncharacterized protein n=1 Tax=Pluteus cervinus TaxID=181527 RepID=A0ACD3AKA7_9AGAR|nr:hypothetical protein BDN72DRAFT_844673 [Pluteus cervinus]